MDGARVQKKSGGKPGPAVWVPAAILAVLLAAYLGLCGWVSASDTILPNVTAAGLDLSGMTQAEAEQAINENLSVAQQAGSGWAVGLSCDGYIGTLDGSSFQVDVASLAQASLSVGRGSFFTGGAQYLRHLFGAAQDLGADQVQLTEAGRTELERQLQAADSALGSGGSEDGYTADLEAGTLTLVKGHTHRSVDRQGAEEAVKSAYAQLLAQGQADTVQLPILDSAPQEPDFQAIHGELYAEAANAAIDPDTCEVLPHTVGVDFDTAQAQRLFQQAQEGETVEVPLTVTQPDITQEILADRLFADLLGQGTSQVSGSSNRKFNVKLSAEACNGVILMPGEVFSYNNTTGSRSAAKGYLPAPVYSGGASVDETGGGICQTSSTIYYAVLHTTLEIVERHAHMYSVGYVPRRHGRHRLLRPVRLRFKNNTDYPVKIVTRSYDKNGLRYLTVKIYGTNNGRPVRRAGAHAVRLCIPHRSTAPTAIPRGTTKVDAKQNAYTGRSTGTPAGGQTEQTRGVTRSPQQDHQPETSAGDRQQLLRPRGYPAPDTGDPGAAPSRRTTSHEIPMQGKPARGKRTIQKIRFLCFKIFQGAIGLSVGHPIQQ